MAKAKKPWWQSLTKVGSVLLAIGTAAQSPGIAEALPPGFAPWGAVLQAVGMGLAGFGVRNALEPKPT